jgi:UDP-glucose 4-epimerase
LVNYSSVLVTGGAGFIGSHIVDQLLAEGVKVIVLDNLRTGRLKNVSRNEGKESLRFVRGDVRDSRLIKELVNNVDAVFHYAALVNVTESLENPVLVNDVNVNGTLSVLKACLNSEVRRFVYASSCAVYGEAESLPVKEESLLMPTSPYGVSKLAAETYVRVFYKIFGLETVCLRFFNVYGPRQVYNNYSAVITQFMNRLAKRKPLVIFGDGEQTRDFIHVKDVARMSLLALKTREAAGETFNIGTGIATTITQLVNTLLEITKENHAKIEHSIARKGDIKHSVADISKAKKKLHYSPKISLKKGLEELTKSHYMQKH